MWRVHGRYCPDWAPDNRVPVHARPTPDSEVLDHLDVFAESWFHCQERGALTRLGPASSTWWAAAESPGRVRGWVSQVYFRGAPDDTPDGGLEFCRADDRRGMSRTVPDPVPVAVPWRHAGGR
ncbi:hypothetical protein ACQEU5_03920 [Marinactinospora thermotolerans]|uniref:Uncharacterized protein n=1 Tax=Marinactinospora thermotolerans DSM 45154 TaxID=1122192 RepID=A0A1T4Q747_9ACTN|nr:hypothetical protein [Marinactinospora thermotolerans]SJZ99529.1 hypothetical protein SAMN02745673_02076 [Marinactinospora thermotolerans DSM 45154]